MSHIYSPPPPWELDESNRLFQAVVNGLEWMEDVLEEKRTSSKVLFEFPESENETTLTLWIRNYGNAYAEVGPVIEDDAVFNRTRAVLDWWLQGEAEALRVVGHEVIHFLHENSLSHDRYTKPVDTVEFKNGQYGPPIESARKICDFLYVHGVVSLKGAKAHCYENSGDDKQGIPVRDGSKWSFELP